MNDELSSPSDDAPADNEPGMDNSAALDAYWQELTRSGRHEAEIAARRNDSGATAGQIAVLTILHAARESNAAPATPGDRDGQSTATYEPARNRSALSAGMLLGGKLRVLGLLDAGGMGEVYVAWHETLDYEVAIKVLPRHLSEHEESCARFQKAIKAQARVGAHEHIAATLDAGQENGQLYLVMEYVPGIDLAGYVGQQGPLPWQDACDIVRQAALGLQHAHAQGIIHRDIKPSNLIRDLNGKIKILDWGLARYDAGDQGSNGATLTGMGMGTIDYLAPERRDASRADERSDLYSLGCTLYFLLTGQAPFATERSPGAKFAAHESKPPPPVTRVRADVPAEVEAILRRLLAKRPEDRYASAAVLLADLNALMTSAAPPAARAKGPRWRASIVAVAAGLLGCASLGWWFSGGSQQPGTAIMPVSIEAPRLAELRLIFVPPQGDYESVLLVNEASVAGEPPAARHVRPGEAFRIAGRFQRPENWWLLWIDTNGKLDPPTHPIRRQTAVEFPLDGAATTINPTDPSGTHLLLLATSAAETPGGDQRLIAAMQGITPAPPVGLHLWYRPGDETVFRGAGNTRETAQSYMKQIERRLGPAGLQAIAAIFLPWEPPLAKPAGSGGTTDK